MLSGREVFGEERDQAPAGEGDFAFARFPALRAALVQTADGALRRGNLPLALAAPLA